MEAYYLASFETDRGKTVKLKIGRARPGVSPEEAKDALRGMVEANVLSPAEGSLAAASALQYVTVTRTPLDVA